MTEQVSGRDMLEIRNYKAERYRSEVVLFAFEIFVGRPMGKPCYPRAPKVGAEPVTLPISVPNESWDT